MGHGKRVCQNALASCAPDVGYGYLTGLCSGCSSGVLSSLVVYIVSCWFCLCEIYLFNNKFGISTVVRILIFLHFHTYMNPKFCQFEGTGNRVLRMSWYADVELSCVLSLLESRHINKFKKKCTNSVTIPACLVPFISK
jgi:hypothetical protein